MKKERAAALGMLVCLIFLVAGALAAPPGIFQGGSQNQMLSVIETYRARWFALNILWGLSGLSLFLGFVILANTLWASENQALLFIGAAAFGLSGTSFAILSFLRLTNPGEDLLGTNLLQLIWLWSLVFAVFIFGFVLLQAGYPTWLGVLSIVSAVALGIGAATVNLDTAESAYLIPAVAAVVILLKSRR